MKTDRSLGNSRRSTEPSYYGWRIDSLIRSNHSRKKNSEISKFSARINNYTWSNYSQMANSTVTRFSKRVTNALGSSSHLSSVSHGYGSRVNFGITSVVASSWGSAPPDWTSRVHSAIRSNTSGT
ncbi:hypothetical protein AAZX31_18G125100 [Glycine max]|nr:hypothetical protein JHK86_050103 [Glycine max]KAG4935974.1 hypothetical protein JHK85_050893 [Glycine max]KAH1198108.1 hypothetical protein GmHk_18G051739 [Glycine max]